MTETTMSPTASPLLFARKFLRHGKRMASVAPSSRSLARAMCAHVSPAQVQTIVELGAGTGAVTEVALRRMHPRSRLIAVELDQDFAAVLAGRCPRATVLCTDVRDLPRRLADHDVPQVDVVLSGLPTPSLPRDTNAAMFDWLATLGPAVIFSQLTVMPYVYRPMYQRLFERVDFDLVLRNLPPGGAYHCRRLRPDYADDLPGA